MIWRMAWRNAWRNPRRTSVVVTAVAVGIAGVVLTMAVNYGMVVQMVETAISTELGHLQIHAAGFDQNPELAIRLEDGGREGAEALAALRGVEAWARRVRAEGLITSPRSSAGVRVVGIEPERAPQRVERHCEVGPRIVQIHSLRVLEVDQVSRHQHAGVRNPVAGVSGRVAWKCHDLDAAPDLQGVPILEGAIDAEPRRLERPSDHASVWAEFELDA